jgi:hypothetical protein
LCITSTITIVIVIITVIINSIVNIIVNIIVSVIVKIKIKITIIVFIIVIVVISISISVIVIIIIVIFMQLQPQTWVVRREAVMGRAGSPSCYRPWQLSPGARRGLEVIATCVLLLYAGSLVSLFVQRDVSFPFFFLFMFVVLFVSPCTPQVMLMRTCLLGLGL